MNRAAMGVLANPRDEKFAQLIFAGQLSGGAAYVQAGYKAKNENTAIAGAARKLASVSVAARVKELQAAAADRAVTISIADHNQRMIWLDHCAKKILAAINKRKDLKSHDMPLCREFRATMEQAARELGQWDVPEQPPLPAAPSGARPQGFRGTLETLLVKLERFTVEAES